MAHTSRLKPTPPGSPSGSNAIDSAALQAHNTARSRLLDEYFERTKVLHVVQSFITELAVVFKTQLRLPANVYPELLERIRVQELCRALELQHRSHASLDIALLTPDNSSTASDFLVYRVENEVEKLSLPAWGCKSTLERLSAANLRGLLGLLDSAFSALIASKDLVDDDYRTSVYVALVGHCIFGARSEDLQPSFLELEGHVFVLGAQLEKAMTVFARFLLKQLHEASSAAASAKLMATDGVTEDFCYCIDCDGVMITTQSHDDVDTSVWTLERALENRAAFVNAVKMALVSHAELTLTRYYCTKRSTGDHRLFQVVQFFFFHFAFSTGSSDNDSNKSVSTVKKAYDASSNTASRSFLTGSRVLHSGLLFDADGALKIATRFREEAQMEAEATEREKKLQKQKHKKSQTAANDDSLSAPPNLASTRSRLGFPMVVQDALDKLNAALSSSTCLKHTNQLISCFAYSLAQLVEAHGVIKRVLERWNGSDVVLVMIRAGAKALQVRLSRFLDESLVSLPSSVVHPVHSLLRHFHARVNGTASLADDQEIDEFLEALDRIDELCLIIIQIIVGDLQRLVETIKDPEQSSGVTAQPCERQLHVDATDFLEIDVPRALETAINDRKYPRIILSEAVFAQALIDSCLDVALESAVMNTVAVCLPPNPFIELSSHLQVFAIRQLVWQHALPQVPSKVIEEVVRPDTCLLFAVEGRRLYCGNSALLELMDNDRVAEIQQWLEFHNVLHTGSYVPSKSSYSATIFPCLLAFHPLALARPVPSNDEAPVLYEETHCMEHYVLEGSEFLQARLFFADAVRKDLRRIVSSCGSCSRSSDNNCWQFPVEARVIDRHGQSLTTLDLSPSTTDDLLGQIIEEAVQVQCFIQVSVDHAETRAQGESSVLLIHRVNKAYAFHHKSTESAESSCCLSPLVSHRLVQYAVFFSQENALFCLQHPHESVVKSSSKLGRESTASLLHQQQTPFASQARQLGDHLLLYELQIASQRESSVAQPQEDNDRELIRRLVTHSKLLQLFSLERAVEWLIESLQAPQHQHGQAANSGTKTVDTYSPIAVGSIHQRFLSQIAAQMKELVVPLNCELRFLPSLASHLTSLQQRITSWRATLPLSDEQLKLQQPATPSSLARIPDTPREDPVTVTSELIAGLRAMQTQLLFFRFSYQRAFFSNGPEQAADTGKAS